jgi:hypothetical protein
VAKLSKQEETKIKSAAKLKNKDGESSDKEKRRERHTKFASLPRVYLSTPIFSIHPIARALD